MTFQYQSVLLLVPADIMHYSTGEFQDDGIVHIIIIMMKYKIIQNYYFATFVD